MDDLVSFTILLYLIMLNFPPLAIDSTLNVCLSLGIVLTMIKFTTNIFHVQFLKMIFSFVICTLGYNLQSSTLGNLVRDSDKCEVLGTWHEHIGSLTLPFPKGKKLYPLVAYCLISLVARNLVCFLLCSSPIFAYTNTSMKVGTWYLFSYMQYFSKTISTFLHIICVMKSKLCILKTNLKA
jgi:hypothetical protein